ncbi:MAG: hypothetical protein ISR57_04560 [Bacteroidales bacterium]|nr:hypothetical protein [Bacteroidota bacterium]MBL6949899.1 hypothetical protein [Bacteroidales bacterium]
MMDKSNRHDKFIQFREEYPFFVYESYDYTYSDRGLDIRFHFNLSDRFHFYPTINIPPKTFFIPEEQIRELLPNLVFHLGMIELISYWKAACSPQVIIRPHRLSPEQLSWWKKIWFNGLGEFFYLNSITTDIEQFMKMEVDSSDELLSVACDLAPQIIIPVGGGKDSIVTMEVLCKSHKVTPLILNPRGASVHSVFMAGFAYGEMIGISRKIDPTLLELNDKGFLNGHTPFSALLAFLTILAAIISGKRSIALSNESSANESTIPGLPINHQYSKTFEFEQDFRSYVKEFICPDIDYFSFLRPLNEIQIASLFVLYPNYFTVFRSCNKGSKSDSWCGSCPKCLFTFIILAPFLKRNQLIEIFQKDLLDDIALKPIFDQLIGKTPEKPFECVGTISEVNATLQVVVKQYNNNPLPALLEYYTNSPVHQFTNSPIHQFTSFLQTWDPQNFLPPELETLLKGALDG